MSKKIECLVHYKQYDSETKSFDLSERGATNIRNAKNAHQRNVSGKEDEEHIQVCKEIDSMPKKYPWNGEKHHKKCYKKFTKVCAFKIHSLNY